MSNYYGVTDGIEDSESLMETEVILNSIVEDLEARTKKIYDRVLLTGERKLPKLPKYSELCRSNQLFYKVYSEYLEYYDEIVDLRIRVSSITRQLKECLIKDSRGYNTSLAKSFNNGLNSKIEALEGRKFELIDVGKMISGRIDLLKSISYTRGEDL